MVLRSRWNWTFDLLVPAGLSLLVKYLARSLVKLLMMVVIGLFTFYFII